jgi:3-hydroxyisobutyrate dehydrogenase
VLGEKAGLDRDRLLDALGQTAVVAPSYKGKLENARRSAYPVSFALQLMYKDFGLVLREATEFAVPMPVTVVAQQLCAAEYARRREEDYSAVIGLMEDLAGLSNPAPHFSDTPMASATTHSGLRSRVPSSA